MQEGTGVMSAPLGKVDGSHRYILLECIPARGGMGEVYAAYDRLLDHSKVALKLLLNRSGEDDVRLVREAHAMARLSHPNVVAIFDTGTMDERLFLAMEFVSGTTLKHWQSARGRSWRDVLRVYIEAGRGLAAAHAAGLVHRDFKPANVLIAHDGTVKVGDFGLARAAGDAPPPAAQHDSISPQQRIARHHGHRRRRVDRHAAVHGPRAVWREHLGRAQRPVRILCGRLRGALRPATLRGR